MPVLQPNITVELGVDYGYSLFCMAAAQQGHVYGIDTFAGDDHAGVHTDAETTVRHVLATNGYDNVSIIKRTFDQAAAEWSKPIDLLHIDGRHDYADAHNDWQRWSPYLSDRAVVMFHDTETYTGVRQVFDEIEWPKINFTQSAGLGVVSKNAELIQEILRTFKLNDPQLKVYFHVIDRTPKCRPVIEKITNAFISSELIEHADIEIHCNYEADNFEWLYQKLKRWPRCQLVFPMSRPEESEIPTLRAMKNAIDIDPVSSNVLYLHSKGVTHNNPAVDDWCDYMLYFNVTRWRDAVSKLNEGYDTCGVNWWGNFEYPHYSGTFWWARGDYLKKLPKFPNPQHVDPERSGLGLKCGYRNDAEFWIGLNNPRAYSMHDSGIDHYWFRYPAYLYK